jgi:hypothetical protein
MNHLPSDDKRVKVSIVYCNKWDNRFKFRAGAIATALDQSKYFAVSNFFFDLYLSIADIEVLSFAHL